MRCVWNATLLAHCPKRGRLVEGRIGERHRYPRCLSLHQIRNWNHLRRILILAVLLAVALATAIFLISCSSNDASAGGTTTATVASPHQISPAVQKQIVADARTDLDEVAAVGKNPSVLTSALMGKALSEMEAEIDGDLAQGKYRKRDFSNIVVKIEDYSAPVAEVSADFDDSSYYVDAKTGAQLGQPASQHRSYALAMQEEGGRWKISQFLSANATTTGRQPAAS